MSFSLFLLFVFPDLIKTFFKFSEFKNFGNKGGIKMSCKKETKINAQENEFK